MQFLELKGKAWLIPITAEKPAEAISEAIKVHLNPIPDIDISFEKIDEATTRSLLRENESAEILARNGYNIEQNPKVPGTRESDYIIEGEVFGAIYMIK